MNMGIAPYNITSLGDPGHRPAPGAAPCTTASAPMQRCPSTPCWPKASPQAEVDAGITLYEPVGCDECTEGYKGRIGIYQVMPMSEEIQQIILEGGNAMQIAEAAQNAGVNDLRQSGLKSRPSTGVTSLAEINRVTKD